MQLPNDVWRLIAEQASPLGAERVDLLAAAGRVLAQAIVADRDLPPCDRSAMDGYAVRAADVASVPTRLRILGEIAAGSDAAPTVIAGTCARIFTGACVPPGADAVVMQEHTGDAGAALVEIQSRVESGANILRRGEDAPAGAVLVPEGTTLDPLPLAAAAAVGCARVQVCKVPRVAILTTGEELVDTDGAPTSYQIRDANGPLLEAALGRAGMRVSARARLADDAELLAAALREATADADAVLVVGGMSVGRYDLAPAAITAIGARTLVHGVAIKPGKPFLFAMAGRCLIFGLPGNPVSAVVGLYEFVLPALLLRAGLSVERARPLLPVRLSGRVAGSPGRLHLVPARLRWTPEGPLAIPVPSHSSADLASAASADGAILVPPEAGKLTDGAHLGFRPWRPLL